MTEADMTMNSHAGSLRRLALAALLLVSPLASVANGDLKIGDPFPDLSGLGLEGDLPTALRGSVLVVDFWASWCAPCRHTFPLMEELHHRFGNRGLIILAINEDKSRPAMNEFLKENPVTFRVLRDARKKLAVTVNIPGLPTSYLVDRNGKVQAIQSGEDIIQNRRAFVKKVQKLLDNTPKIL